MKPTNLLSRRDFLWTPIICGTLSLTLGCTNPILRPQSPEKLDVSEFDQKIRLIGDVSGPYGLNYAMVESAALVVNLPDTGCDPPVSPMREQLMADMMARNVANPNQLLASPTTALVWIKAYIPPAAEEGDQLDIEVRVPDGHETSDLSGGWMLEARLREMGVDVQGGVHQGHVLVKAEGALLVDPENGSENDRLNKLTGRILSGGRVIKTRTFGLIIKNEDRSVFLSKQIGESINRRFHTYQAGTKRGVATPKNDAYVDLLLHPRYKHNIPRYIRVIRAIPLRETANDQLQRLALLEQQLLDPISAGMAAIKLEAIGKNAIPTLRKGIESNDAEVRFYAAEALAYLDDSQAAIPLAEAARDQAAFRIFAFTALSTMDDVAATDELKTLLDSPSVETRTGAFRALWGMNRQDPAIRGEHLGERVWLHQVASKATSLVHVNRYFRPEVILFGNDHRLRGPATLEAGKQIIVKIESESQVTLCKFSVGDDDKRQTVNNNLPDVIRAIVTLGGHYPDVIQFLNDASKQRALSSRLEVEKYPIAGRRFERDADTNEHGSDDESYEVGWAMPNLFGRRQSDAIVSDQQEQPKNPEKTESKP